MFGWTTFTSSALSSVLTIFWLVTGSISSIFVSVWFSLRLKNSGILLGI